MSEPLDLEGIRKRAEAATPGPWGDCGCGKCSQVWSVPVDCPVAVGLTDKDEGFTGGEGVPRTDANTNARFIAHARSDIPALIREVERLREELSALKSGSGGD